MGGGGEKVEERGKRVVDVGRAGLVYGYTSVYAQFEFNDIKSYPAGSDTDTDKPSYFTCVYAARAVREYS